MLISFIILTYNRSYETYEAIKNIIYHLNKPSGIIYEIIIFNNNSTADYSDLEDYIAKFPFVKYIKNEKNEGVAIGRNKAFSYAQGEICISLDDDAEFIEENIIEKTLKLFAEYKQSKVALLTYKVVERSDGSIDIASKNKDDLKKDQFYTTYFKGGAHAVIKSVFDELGGYTTTGLYGAEEYDLAYRILDKGYRILHTSDISILHKKAASGRQNYPDQLGNLLLNKSIIAYRFLPFRYFISHLFMWSGFFIMKTNGNIWALLKYVFQAIKTVISTDRQPISKSTIQYIQNIGGRVSY